MNKKIYIVTVYDSLNYGSFFQAFALNKKCRDYHESYFLNIKHQNIFFQTVERVLKDLLRFRFASAKLEYNKFIKFRCAQQIFSISKKNMLSEKDVMLFGSDEIWNIGREKIAKSKEFFGFGFENKEKYSVAPSINETSLEQLRAKDYIYNELTKFKQISVRDNHTKKIIDELLKIDSYLISDPTMMYDMKFYNQYKVKTNLKNYIIIYTYGRMLNQKVQNEILKFAKEKKKILVSVGKWIDFCDYCVAPSPWEFLDIIENASYILTDTFHGTVFSIIYEKQFLTFPCNNTKVEELIKQFNLDWRMWDKCSPLSDFSAREIDYSRITPVVRKFGLRTEMYLHDILSGE